MVKEYLRPRTPEEALALLRGREDSCLLSGGTYLLSSQFSGEPMTLISLSGILPDKVRPQGNGIALGANMTFSALLETSGLPPALLDAARSMGNRNIRNRATVGGNVGADKSCSSLIPFFIVSQASYARIDMQPVAAEDWETMAAECGACACGPDRGIVSEVVIPTQEGRQIAFDRFGRVAGDISIVTCAVSAELDAGRRLRNIMIAMGGMAQHVRRFPELEKLFEGSPVPSRKEIEEAASPFLHPESDLRGSAAYKRQRAVVLLADLIGSFKTEAGA